MSSLASIKTQIQSLITLANATTGNNDTTLTACVNSLIEGYGGATYELAWDISKRTKVDNVNEAKTVAHACVCSRKNYIVGIASTGLIDYRKVTNLVVNGNDVTFTIPEYNNYNIGLPYQLDAGASYTFKATASVSARLRVATFDTNGLFVEDLASSSSGTSLTLTFTANSNQGYWTVLMLDGRTVGQTTTFTNISIVKN